MWLGSGLDWCAACPGQCATRLVCSMCHPRPSSAESWSMAVAVFGVGAGTLPANGKSFTALSYFMALTLPFTMIPMGIANLVQVRC